MNSPCERKDIIDIIRADLTEVKQDIKLLLEFKNKALGIIVSLTLILQVIGFIISTIIK